MILWTIQDIRAYDRLNCKKMLYGDWRRVERQCFKPAYKWMVKQMDKRGIKTNGKPPIWGWPQKPDLRHIGNLPSKSHGVRIKANVPDDLILLSNYEDWHCVLNDTYLPTDEELDGWDLDSDDGLPNYTRRQILKSWGRVFESFTLRKAHIQACFPILREEWVIDVTKFIAR